VNPDPDSGKQRVTGIGTAHARRDEVEGLLTAAGSFGLTDAQATQALSEVAAATTAWRQVAAANGIRERELSRMAGAFDGLRARAQ
jgi:serine/threonine-protein kinase HipA